MSTKTKRSLYAFLSIALSLLGLFLILELALRFAPVPTGLSQLPVNESNPVVRHAPNRTLTWSKGWFFELANQVRVNNWGFFSDIDYDANVASPLLAVVGDSYVEAAMLAYDQTLHGRLSGRLGARARVYSFAVSGAALSQYLVFAEFARDSFGPKGLVVVVVSNDFDECFPNYGGRPGLHYFEELPRGELRLQRADFEVSLLRSVARSSALARYLAGNLPSLQRWRRPSRGSVVGGTWASTDERRVDLSTRAVEYFLEELPGKAGLTPRDIVFLVDGIRPELYDAEALEEANDSFIATIRHRFIEEARARGFETIDLQPRQIRRFRRDGTRFEFPIDSHWNGEGHQEAARAVLESAMFRRLFDDQAGPTDPGGQQAPLPERDKRNR